MIENEIFEYVRFRLGCYNFFVGKILREKYCDFIENLLENIFKFVFVDFSCFFFNLSE